MAKIPLSKSVDTSKYRKVELPGVKLVSTDEQTEYTFLMYENGTVNELYYGKKSKKKIKKEKAKKIKKGVCCYCNKEMEGDDYTNDHLIALNVGGKNSQANKKPCCKKCNSEKGNLSPYQYLVFVKKHQKGNLRKIFNIEQIISYCEVSGPSLFKDDVSYNSYLALFPPNTP